MVRFRVIPGAAKGQEDPTGLEPDLEHAKGVSWGVHYGGLTDHPCLEVNQLHGREGAVGTSSDVDRTACHHYQGPNPEG